ncbi:hypothetical protein DFJ74DRAFT_74867 [Hyaloraphidium curvatum]|nr:hypothetical protein DFJ74DRAFT_74867 [Hyaloraphidium curvatum]
MQAAQQQHQAAQHAALRQQQAAAMGSVPGMQSPNQQMLSALMGAGAGPGSLNQTLLQQMAGAGHVLDPQSPGSSAFKDTVRRELQASNQQQQFAAAARNSLQGGFAGPGAPGAPGGQGGLIGSSANAAASSRAELIISAINVDSSGQQQHAQGQNPGGSNGRRPSVPPGPPPGMGDFMSPGPGPVPSPFPKPAQMPSGTATILTQSQMQALADQTRANFNGGAPPSPFPPGSESFDPTSPAGNPSVAQQHMQQIRAAQQRERQEQQNLAIRQQLLSASSRFAGPGEPQQPGDGLMSPPAMRPDELRAPSGGSVGPAGYGSFGRMGPPPPQQRGISPAAGTPQMQPGQAGGEAQGNRYRAMLDILIHDYLRKSGYTAASAALVNESESIRSTMVGRPGQPGQPGGVPRLPDQMDLPDSILLEWFSAGWERWFAPPPGGFPAPSPQQSPGTLANARAAALTQAGGLRPGAAAPSPVVPFGTPNPAPAGARADPGSAAGVLGMPRASLKGVMDHLGLKDKDPDQLSQQDIEAIMHRSAMEGEEGGPPFKRQRTEEFEGFGGNGQQMRGGVGQMSPMAGFQQMLAQNDLQSPPGSVPQTAQDILGALGGISGTPPAARESAQIARHAQAAQRRAAGLSGLPGAGYQPQGLPPGFPGTSTGSMGSPLGVGARPPTPGSGQLESPDVARAVPGQQMPGATVQAQLRQQQLIMIQQQQAGGFQQPGGSRSFTGESPASAKSPAESNAPSSGTRGGKRRAAAEGSPPSESPQAGKKGRKPPANREAPPSPKRKAPARTRNVGGAGSHGRVKLT